MTAHFVLILLVLAQPLPSVPFDAYHLCLFVRRRTLDIGYASISLFYGVGAIVNSAGMVLTVQIMCTQDFLAFLSVIFFAKRTKTAGLKIPTILGTIAEDATRYFLVIFTSHFVLVMTLNLGRVSTPLPLSLWTQQMINYLSCVSLGINPTPSSQVGCQKYREYRHSHPHFSLSQSAAVSCESCV